MKVVHDNELGGVAMIPLICDWGIKKICQIKGCAEITNAIVCFNANESPTNEALHIGICEKHHQESVKQDSFNYTIERRLGS